MLKCPYCDTLISNLRMEEMESRDFGNVLLVFGCPFCFKTLGIIPADYNIPEINEERLRDMLIRWGIIK